MKTTMKHGRYLKLFNIFLSFFLIFSACAPPSTMTQQPTPQIQLSANPYLLEEQSDNDFRIKNEDSTDVTSVRCFKARKEAASKIVSSYRFNDVTYDKYRWTSNKVETYDATAKIEYKKGKLEVKNLLFKVNWYGFHSEKIFKRQFFTLFKKRSLTFNIDEFQVGQEYEISLDHSAKFKEENYKLIGSSRPPSSRRYDLNVVENSYRTIATLEQKLKITVAKSHIIFDFLPNRFISSNRFGRVASPPFIKARIVFPFDNQQFGLSAKKREFNPLDGKSIDLKVKGMCPEETGTLKFEGNSIIQFDGEQHSCSHEISNVSNGFVSWDGICKLDN